MHFVTLCLPIFFTCKNQQLSPVLLLSPNQWYTSTILYSMIFHFLCTMLGVDCWFYMAIKAQISSPSLLSPPIIPNNWVTSPLHPLVINQITPIGVRETPNMSGKQPGKDPQVSKTIHCMQKWDGMLVPQAIQAPKFTKIHRCNYTLPPDASPPNDLDIEKTTEWWFITHFHHCRQWGMKNVAMSMLSLSPTLPTNTGHNALFIVRPPLHTKQ